MRGAQWRRRPRNDEPACACEDDQTRCRRHDGKFVWKSPSGDPRPSMAEPSPFAAWLGQGDPRGRPAGSFYAAPPQPPSGYGAARPPLGSGYYALDSTMQRLSGGPPSYGSAPGVYVGGSHLLAAQPPPRLAYAPLPPSPYATALAVHPGMVRPVASQAPLPAPSPQMCSLPAPPGWRAGSAGEHGDTRVAHASGAAASFMLLCTCLTPVLAPPVLRPRGVDQNPPSQATRKAALPKTPCTPPSDAPWTWQTR
jgi:hypothetical protein